MINLFPNQGRRGRLPFNQTKAGRRLASSLDFELELESLAQVRVSVIIKFLKICIINIHAERIHKTGIVKQIKKQCDLSFAQAKVLTTIQCSPRP